MSERTLYYFKHNNLGDKLNEIIPEMLSGDKYKYQNFSTCDMIAIGSQLEKWATNSILGDGDKAAQGRSLKDKEIALWGTGFMHAYDDYSKMEAIRPTKVYAVRGELTKAAVEKILGHKIKCETGDPGILAPLLLDSIPKKKYSLGIIPHYADASLPIFSEIQEKIENSKIIDIAGDDPVQILEEIASCKAIISTSLHGCIISDSMNIPNLWCVASDNVAGNGFKYKDYYSGYGLDINAFQLSSTNIPQVDNIIKNYKVPFKAVRKKQKQLINCFPYYNEKSKKAYKKLHAITKELK